MHILQKINIKQRPFIDWPLSIQRILLMMAGILLFLLFNKQLFTTTEQMVVAYKKNTDELANKVQIQQRVIQQARMYLYQKSNKNTLLNRVGTLNLSSFMAQLSESSRKNHLEIQAMKPMTSQKFQEKKIGFIIQPFQISVTGEYNDLLQFMHHIAMFPILAMVDDFQMTTMPTGNSLKLVAIVDLYVRESL